MKFLIALFTLSVSFFAYADSADVQALKSEIPFLASPEVNILTGGQPTNNAWQPLAKAGVTTVINLRSDAEMQGSNEAKLVTQQGMQYIHIPIAGAGDITPENAQRLQQALAQVDGKVLVHCASSNRVGALLALDAANSQTQDEALKYGRSAGLTSLEGTVKQVLNNNK